MAISQAKKEQTVGYRYSLGMHLVWCLGPVDALRAIRAGDREAWTGSVTGNTSIQISARELFGGEEREGGIEGTLDVMMGGVGQAANAYLTAQQGAAQPAYLGVLGTVWRGLIGANNPYVKPWAALLTRILAGWQGGAAWYPERASVTVAGTNFPAANPAHIVYEALTNQDWGMGYSAGLINDANFRAAADVFHSEGMGLCIAWTRQQTIERFIQQIVEHCGAVLAQNPTTGLFELAPLRGGYSVPALPEFSPANVIALESYQRPSLAEGTNEVQVRFADVNTGQAGSITVQNIAAVQAQGGVVAASKEYPGIPTADLALRVAMRDLRAVSTPLAKVRMRVNRAGHRLTPGGLLRLTWPALGITDLVLRVAAVDTGSSSTGQITIEAAEDIFGLDAAVYAQQPPIGWQDPNSLPAPASARRVEEAPYYEIQRLLSSTELAALPADAGFLVTVAGKPTGDARTYTLRTRPGTSGAFGEVGVGDFAPYGLLQDAIGPGATAATLTAMRDANAVQPGGYAMIGAEIVRIDTFNASTGAVTMGRGVLDTVAAAHPIGTPLIFADGYLTTDSIERADGEVLQAKLLTRTGRGLLAEGDAPTDTVTFDERARRPYPPGRLRINGTAYPATLTNAQPALTWAHRNRLQQNLEGDEAGNIGPEAGTTYTVRISRATDDLQLATQSGITGTAFTAAEIFGVFPMRIEAWSVRAGLQSRQKHDWTLAYDNRPPLTLPLSASLEPGAAFGNTAATVNGFTSANGSGIFGGKATIFGGLGDEIAFLLRASNTLDAGFPIDASDTAVPISRQGSTVERSAEQARWGGHSIKISGSGFLRLGTAESAQLQLAMQIGAAYAVEGWALMPAGTNEAVLLEAQSTDTFFQLRLSRDPSSEPGHSVMRLQVTRVNFGIFEASQPAFRGATPDGTWVHWALCVDRNETRVFIDGACVTLNRMPPLPFDWRYDAFYSPPLLIGDLRIGSSVAGKAPFYIDDVAITMRPKYARTDGLYFEPITTAASFLPAVWPADFTRPPTETPAPAAARDQHFAQVSVLLRFDEADGATTVADSSTFARSLTVQNGAGAVVAGASPLASSTTGPAGALQLALDGSATASWLQLSAAPAAAEFNLATGDWTVECWLRTTSTLAVQTILSVRDDAASDPAARLGLRIDVFFDRIRVTSGAQQLLTPAGGVQVDRWIRLVVERKAGLLRIYTGDSVQAELAGFLVSTPGTAAARIGADNAGGDKFIGRLAQVRITKGTARYGTAAPLAIRPQYRGWPTA